MKLIAVYEDIYMFVDDDVNEPTIDTKCITYNAKTERTSPRIAIGSWTGRMGPWREPTKEELKKDWSFVEKEA